ncbi:hypothetical protein OOU_Y34scaffold00897g4 [Pyricularia oryzae Y34]|uniref:Uncharacterized protein n=3 Tax=Pyricularia oryzae TaxID=318829 RepID=Q2KEL1_PYRO7|nr:hypothetical protein MGCH7_ch7g1025 [Pyricularia oryzae 70-15]ELQ33708.1 hypothetical protein OOU_Y34scaffold00897g4 [Pyricularia oryzae Y34]
MAQVAQMVQCKWFKWSVGGAETASLYEI